MKRVRIRLGSTGAPIANTVASIGDRVRIGDTTVSKKELAWALADIMTNGSRLADDVVPGAVCEFIERQIGLRLAPLRSQVSRNMGSEPHPQAVTTIAELASLCEVELANDLLRRTYVVSIRLLDGRSEVMIPYEVLQRSTSAGSEIFRPFVEDLAIGMSNLLHNQLVVRIGRMVLQDYQRVGYGTPPERGRW